MCASNFYSQRQFVRLFAAWPHVFSRYLCRDYVSYEAMRVSLAADQHRTDGEPASARHKLARISAQLLYLTGSPRGIDRHGPNSQ
jgi:hypothetical protein